MTLGHVPPVEKSDFETSKPHGRCDNGCMAARADYCHFTKAIEHLGDRWSLQIVRQLILLGPQGFNALRVGLPGIARSVLVDRLQKLDELGIVARTPTASGRASAYRVTPAGELLKPVMIALVEWAQRWDPDDPAAAARDPDLIVWWLSRRASTADLPSDQIVVALDIRGTRAGQFWLVLERGVGSSICISDPCLGDDRYVHVEADAAAIYPLARGQRRWSDAVADGSVQLFGEPSLIRALPAWFGDHRTQPPRIAATA